MIIFNEVVNLLNPIFKAKPPQIKKRIEDLIDRNYLKRDPNNINVLIYIP